LRPRRDRAEPRQHASMSKHGHFLVYLYVLRATGAHLSPAHRFGLGES
jgi:hypothetical protein